MAEIQSSFKRVEKKFVLTEKEYEILLPVITQHMVSDLSLIHISEPTRP